MFPRWVDSPHYLSWWSLSVGRKVMGNPSFTVVSRTNPTVTVIPVTPVVQAGHFAPFMDSCSWEDNLSINITWKGLVGKSPLDQGMQPMGCSANQCILPAGKSCCNKDTAGEIFPSTANVWIGKLAQFFHLAGWLLNGQLKGRFPLRFEDVLSLPVLSSGQE